MVKRISVILTLLILNSCSKIIPAKFWTKYEKDKITSNFSDQGPFGGTTIINWSSKNKGFKEDELISFAKENDWNFIDSMTIQNGELKTAKRNYTVELINENNKFDNEFKNGKFFLFKTGMIAIKPGNSTETETNGFLILNQNKTELKLFHK